MDTFDLRKISSDQLIFLLDTAKGELAKYTPYVEELERCKDNIKKARDKDCDHEVKTGCLVGGALLFVGIFGLFFWVFLPLVWALLIPAIVCFAYVFFKYIIPKKMAKENMAYHEAELTDLWGKERDAASELKAALLIPADYCYDYALRTMIKFLKNQQASNWERVTYLFDEHIYRLKMEVSAQQLIEQSKLQTEYIREARDRTSLAALGACASAIGIWISNNN